MRFVIVTGMSGAGKSTAIKMMEDIGFYCVDNLPIPLLEKFVELTTLQSAELQKVAVGIDIRSGQSFDELHGVLDHMKDNGVEYEILFLDAEDSVLVKRYKETRRNHPLAGGERVDKGIEEERKRLAFLKERADYIIDTSQLLDLNMEYRSILIWYLMSVFYQTRIMWRACGQRPEMIKKFRIMSCSFRKQMFFWTNLKICWNF